MPESIRVNPEAIRAFLARGAWWKFVVSEPGEVGEVLRLAERFALPRERVLLQPEGLRRRGAGRAHAVADGGLQDATASASPRACTS